MEVVHLEDERASFSATASFLPTWNGLQLGTPRGGISRVTAITLGRLAQSYDLRSLGDCWTSLALRGDLTVGALDDEELLGSWVPGITPLQLMSWASSASTTVQPLCSD